jgi:hypothetical protein
VTVAFGTEIRREYNNNLALNGGTFTFSSLSNFLADSASQYTVLLGNGNDKLLAPSYGFFPQDNFKMAPYFMLELGLRYEANLTPSEAAANWSSSIPRRRPSFLSARMELTGCMIKITSCLSRASVLPGIRSTRARRQCVPATEFTTTNQ